MHMKIDLAVISGLGLGAAYLHFVSDYGAAVLTTLAILTAAVTLLLRITELWSKRKK